MKMQQLEWKVVQWAGLILLERMEVKTLQRTGPGLLTQMDGEALRRVRPVLRENDPDLESRLDDLTQARITLDVSCIP